MRSSACKLMLVVAAVLSIAAASASSAPAAISFAPCGNTNAFACGHLSVPLDPSGATPGSITLAIRRHLAPVGPARSAIVALAGGPGQSALPFAEDFAETLGPIASTRDLIVFDQRGTGLSHPLSCHAFERSAPSGSPGQLVAGCAAQLGPTRSFFTTADSVSDIEALREAGGYEKLVLYGTSYGTKVAEEYAQRYPTHVEALVLDSVVTPGGPDPLSRSTFTAIPRILRQLCEFRDCSHVTPEPVADLARLVRRMHKRAVRAGVVNGDGVSTRVSVNADDLLGILLAGDFDPILRAEFPSAVRSASYGDAAPLARLLAQAESGSDESGDIDTPLYLATTCEEQLFPWNRTAPARTRLEQAKATIDKLPTGAIAPFSTQNVLDFSDIPSCAFWPYTPQSAALEPAAASAPLPNVPTLILSGADDLRTPTSEARSVARSIPDSHLLVVPETGHSVLGSEGTPCAEEALQSLFAGHPIKQCRATRPVSLLRPTPIAPWGLAAVSPIRGYRGRTGRTLQAVKLTLADFSRQLTLTLGQSAESGGLLSAPTLRSGGLRGGWAELSASSLDFHRYSYVPGITISGTVSADQTNLLVAGPSAARGRLRLGPHHTLVGVLGGEHVHLATAGSSATVASAAPARVASTLPRDLARPARERLAILVRAAQRLLGGLLAGHASDLSILSDLWADRRAASAAPSLSTP